MGVGADVVIGLPLGDDDGWTVGRGVGRVEGMSVVGCLVNRGQIVK